VTRAVLMSGAAGALVAAALVDLAAGWTRARRESAPRAATAARHRLLAILAAAGRRLGAPAASGDLAARLAAAGASPSVTPAEVMAVKGGAAVAVLLGGVPFASALPGRTGLLALAALPVAGFLAPDLLLRRRAARRAAAMTAELPDVLDLLRVALEAGLPTTRALAEAARRMPGPFARELGCAAARAELGVPRALALQELAARAPLEQVHALVSLLGRADRHGAPPAEAVEALTAQARADRARRLTEQAARAAPKIQLIVALLLVPAVMLLVAAGMVSSLT